MDFYTGAGSCAQRNISNAGSLQREAERSVSNLFLVWQRTAASTVSQCEEKWLDGFRKCPITGGLLLPVGFPLEQLSVSVSLGKPREHGANDASVLKETSRAFNASEQLFVSILRPRLKLPGFGVPYQVVSQGLGQTSNQLP